VAYCILLASNGTVFSVDLLVFPEKDFLLIICNVHLLQKTGSSTCSARWYYNYWGYYWGRFWRVGPIGTVSINGAGCAQWRTVLAFSFIAWFLHLLSGILVSYFHNLTTCLKKVEEANVAYFREYMFSVLISDSTRPSAISSIMRRNSPSKCSQGKRDSGVLDGRLIFLVHKAWRSSKRIQSKCGREEWYRRECLDWSQCCTYQLDVDFGEEGWRNWLRVSLGCLMEGYHNGATGGRFEQIDSRISHA
jgi:hypothetical protein